MNPGSSDRKYGKKRLIQTEPFFFFLILAVKICFFLRVLPGIMQLNLFIKWPPSIKQPVIKVPK